MVGHHLQEHSTQTFGRKSVLWYFRSFGSDWRGSVLWYFRSFGTLKGTNEENMEEEGNRVRRTRQLFQEPEVKQTRDTLA